MKKTRRVIFRERVRFHGNLKVPGVERLRSQWGIERKERMVGAGGDGNRRGTFGGH